MNNQLCDCGNVFTPCYQNQECCDECLCAEYGYAEDYRKQARLDPYAGCYLTYNDLIDERMF